MAKPSVEIRNSKFSLKNVKALLFDLDDTLYFIPSGGQFKRYGENLAALLPEPQQTSYLAELDDAWNDGSPLKVGRSFAPETQWILDFDDEWQLMNAYTLEGKKVSESILRQRYPAGIRESDIKGLIHLASGWAIPTALGRLRGMTREDYRQAYLVTRAEMMRSPERFPLIHPPELPQFLSQLHQQDLQLFVATNSDFDDANEVLDRLRIKSFFRKVYGQAKKPVASLALLQDIKESFQLEYSDLLVVGDSVYNDLREAKTLGAQTVLIERFSGQPLGAVDVRVWDLEGFIKLWNSP